MIKWFLVLPLAGFLCLIACQNPNQTAAPANQPTTETAAKSSIPDPNDLLKVLQGRWQSEQDPNYIMEISDTQMAHTQNGNVVYQATLDVDGACQSPVCKPDGVDTSDGWCFTEMTIVERKYNANCMFVTKCDGSVLQYRPLGGSGNSWSFKKIQ